MTIIKKECRLCQLPLKGEKSDFCCPGCRVVHGILSAKGELTQGKEHPLIQEASKRGIISNPTLLESFKEKRSQGDRFRFTFEVTDLFCPSCPELIEWSLMQEEGVVQVHVDYMTDLVFVEYLPAKLTRVEILERVQKLGYSVKELGDIEGERSKKGLVLRLAISAFFALNVMMFSYPVLISLFDQSPYGSYFANLSLLFSLPPLTYGAYPIYRRAILSALKGFFGMEFLATVAVFCAAGLSIWNLTHGSIEVYFDAATALVTLLLFGRLLERRSKLHAKERLHLLQKSLPRRARRVDGRFVSLKEVAIGDQLKVLQGERVVLDGEVITGEALLDESHLTGEAMPRHVVKGELLSAGSILLQGWATFRVTANESESTVQNIIGHMREGLIRKSRITRALERPLKFFLPLLLLLSLTLLLIMPNLEGIYRLITLLLIACPCAIGVAAPLAESRLMSALLKKGVLVQSRQALEVLGKEELFVFDKTKTITKGSFSVVGGLESLTNSEKALLRTLCSYSNHPVVLSLKGALGSGETLPLEEIKERLGEGMEASYCGLKLHLGSRRMFEELCLLPTISQIATTDESELFFYIDKLHTFRLKDEVTEDAKELLANLGVEKWLLSGDQKGCVEIVGKNLKFDRALGELTPLEKQLIIEKENRIVAFVGDGINDAPALSSADLSISKLGSTDLALQSCDLLLTEGTLRAIPEARQMGRFGRRILYQNLFFASIYNLFGIALALTGHLHPLYSTFAMTISSLMVILNSIRIR